MDGRMRATEVTAEALCYPVATLFYQMRVPWAPNGCTCASTTRTATCGHEVQTNTTSTEDFSYAKGIHSRQRRNSERHGVVRDACRLHAQQRQVCCFYCFSAKAACPEERRHSLTISVHATMLHRDPLTIPPSPSGENSHSSGFSCVIRLDI